MENKFAKILTTILASWFVVTIGLVILYRFVPVCVTPLMLIRKAEAFSQGREFEIQHEWVPLTDISPELVAAVINCEDAKFYYHHGFDPVAIRYAWFQNKKNQRIVAGGSTISQQTAKNLFCTLHRNWIRKAFETYFTILIEFLWSKERILEVYLNSIEWGDGVFGAQSAALCHLGHSSRCLTYREAYEMANMIPHPRECVCCKR